MLTNKLQQQAKRRLTFEDAEEPMFTQAKKRAVEEEEEENSSLVPLMKEVRRAEDEDLDFVELVNRPTPKPWVPLKELLENVPHPIIAAREETNKHGRRIILKIKNAGSKSVCEVYLPQRFASCITADKIAQFNLTCKKMSLVVTHKSANWSVVKIVKR